MSNKEPEKVVRDEVSGAPKAVWKSTCTGLSWKAERFVGITSKELFAK